MKFRLVVIKCFLLPLMGGLPVTALAQTCNPAIPVTTPTAMFIVHDDGTATYQPAGLVWMRCSLGQNWDGKTCGGEAKVFTWGAALLFAEGYSFAGYTDWRLPNKNELASIVEESCSVPAINTEIFPATPLAYFWSSSPYNGIGDGAWSVDFGFGPVNASVKNGRLNVRLVRGGP